MNLGIGDQLAIVKPGIYQLTIDQRLAITGQRQHRHPARGQPLLATVHCRQAAQLAIDTAQKHLIAVDDSGRVVEFREKPATAEERAGMKIPASATISTRQP